MFNGMDFDNNQFIYRLRCRFCGTFQSVEKPLSLSKMGLRGVAPVQVVSHLYHCVVQCFVWLTASILAWSRGGSPSDIAPARMPGVYAQRFCTMQSQPSIHSLSRGKGVWGFGKDAEIERPKALQDAKPTKRSYRDREFALSYKNRLFLQTEVPFLRHLLIFRQHFIHH